MKSSKLQRQVKALLLFFIFSLFISGLTAIPVSSELRFLLNFISRDTQLYSWSYKVHEAYKEVDVKYSFLLYGYDWLAFAHFILAILFLGPYRDPVKNIWVIEFGMIACVLVFPLAFIAGHFRGIPIGWQLIDCSFGLVGFLPLWLCYVKTKQIAIQQTNSLN